MRFGLRMRGERFWARRRRERSRLKISCLKLHPDDRSRIRQTINDAIRDAKDYDSEYRSRFTRRNRALDVNTRQHSV